MDFDVFLFDFDGLLVDTEPLHFQAYREMCRRRGCELAWDLNQFFEAAHFDANGLRDRIYATFPRLQKEEPRWDVLYREKKAIFQEILENGKIELMPGVEEMLTRLEQEKRKRAVVTNSTLQQVSVVKERVPLLGTIPLWITREDYQFAKPNPECYKLAISRLGKKGDRVVGFEDSTRGLKALLGAGADLGVLICAPNHPQMKEGLPEGAVYFSSFTQFLNN